MKEIKLNITDDEFNIIKDQANISNQSINEVILDAIHININNFRFIKVVETKLKFMIESCMSEGHFPYFFGKSPYSFHYLSYNRYPISLNSRFLTIMLNEEFNNCRYDKYKFSSFEIRYLNNFINKLPDFDIYWNDGSNEGQYMENDSFDIVYNVNLEENVRDSVKQFYSSKCFSIQDIRSYSLSRLGGLPEELRIKMISIIDEEISKLDIVESKRRGYYKFNS